MINTRKTALPALRTGWMGGLLAALVVLAGCDTGPQMGDVSGTVTVDGNVPAEGSSIDFVPTNGKSSGGGCTIEKGKYATRIPVGAYKVQIHVPRPVGKAPKTAPVEGPGPGEASDIIEESLPAKFNDKTELTLEVKSGKNEKNWDLQTK